MLETTTMVLVSELAVDYFAIDGEGGFFYFEKREGTVWSTMIRLFATFLFYI